MLTRALRLIPQTTQRQIRRRSDSSNVYKTKRVLEKCLKRNDIDRARELWREGGAKANIQAFQLLVDLIYKQKKPALYSPVLLNILQMAVDRNMKFTPPVLEKLRRVLTLQHDYFIRDAAIRLLDKVNTNNPVATAGARMHSHLYMEEIEPAFTIYLDEIHTAFDNEAKNKGELHRIVSNRTPTAVGNVFTHLPIGLLITKMCLQGYYREVSSILSDAERARFEPKILHWTMLLEGAVKNRDYSAATFAYRGLGYSPKVLSTPVLVDLSSLLCLNHDLELLHRLLDEVVQRLGHLPPELAGHVAYAMLSNDQSVLAVFRRLISMYPEIRIEHIPVEIPLQDFNVLHIKKSSPQLKTLLMNYSVRAARVHQSASLAMARYRQLRQFGCEPNDETLEQLAFCAYTMGNSKKLSYEIYNECALFNIKPTRRTMESFLRAALTGRNYDSVFYWLKIMRQQKIQLRAHYHYNLMKRFDEIRDTQYRNVMRRIELLQQYDFPTDDRLRQSSTQNAKVGYNFKFDRKNSEKFHSGWIDDNVMVNDK